MKSMIKPTAILFCICVLVALLLSGVQLLTCEKIAETEAQAKEAAMYAVLPPEVSQLDALSDFASDAFMGVDENGNTVGYVFVCSAKGYGGPVTVTVGFQTDGQIYNIVVSAPEETPGLGVNVQKESWLREEFVGKSADDTLNDVEYVTSATYSSEAVIQAVEEAMENYRTVMGGDGA